MLHVIVYKSNSGGGRYVFPVPIKKILQLKEAHRFRSMPEHLSSMLSVAVFRNSNTRCTLTIQPFNYVYYKIRKCSILRNIFPWSN